MASRPGAAPGMLSFGDSAALAGARLKKLVRLPGVAPGHPPWRGDILLLNHSRKLFEMVGVGRLALPRLLGFEPNWSAIPSEPHAAKLVPVARLALAKPAGLSRRAVPFALRPHGPTYESIPSWSRPRDLHSALRFTRPAHRLLCLAGKSGGGHDRTRIG